MSPLAPLPIPITGPSWLLVVADGYVQAPLSDKEGYHSTIITDWKCQKFRSMQTSCTDLQVISM